MALITVIVSIFLLIGLPANSILMLAIILSTTREIKAYSIIQFNIAFCDFIRISSEFMTQERLIFQWPFTVFIYQGPCTLISQDFCWFLETVIMNLFFYVIILITFSIWYRSAALGGWLPGAFLVRSMLFILPSPILIYMCTFYTASESQSASVILSHHPHVNISSLVFVGMSAENVTPMLFTVSTVTFPIPAYLTISYYCIKLLKTIARSTTMSFKTKRMHESFMKALLYTTIQPTLLFGAIVITFAQGLHFFEPTELSESIITLSASFSTLSNPLATLFFVKQYKNFVTRFLLRKSSSGKEMSVTKKESNCNVAHISR